MDDAQRLIVEDAPADIGEEAMPASDAVCKFALHEQSSIPGDLPCGFEEWFGILEKRADIDIDRGCSHQQRASS